MSFAATEEITMQSKSVLVRGMSEKLYSKLRKAALNEKMSVNKYLLMTLTRVFDSSLKKQDFKDLDHLFGCWSKREYEEVKSNLRFHNVIDKELWK